MHIRCAVLSDSKQISALIIPLVEKYILPSCSQNAAPILLTSMSTEKIAEYIQLGYQYSVIENDNRIIAAIGIKENKHLYHLFVCDQYQGKGYAKKLWQRAKTNCMAQGNNQGFTVNAAVSAANLYEKWGFEALSGIRERGGVKDIPMYLAL